MKSTLFLLTLICLLGCSTTESTQQAPVRPVKYMTVAARPLQAQAAFTGVTKAGREAALAFKVGGVLSELRVKDGQRVRRGQLIAQLETDDYSLSVEQADVQVKQAQTSLNVARSTYERVERLYENNSVSLSEYEQAKGNYEASQAQLDAAEKQVQAARNQVSYTGLKAPFAGVISNLNVEEGELVGVGNPIGLLSAEGEPQVEFGVPDFYISQIEEGQGVSIRLSAFPGERFPGKVAEVSYSQSTTTTYPVRARFAKPDKRIRPGMSVEAQVDLAEQPDMIVVPAKAVGEDAQGRRYVYKLQGAGDTVSVQQQFVEIGALNPAGFSIKEGLAPGDRVATAGLSSLLEGMQVRLLGQ